MPKADPGRERRSWGNVARKNSPAEPNPAPVQQLTPAECIAIIKMRLAEFQEQQRLDLVTTIARVVGPGVCFSARDLWQHRELHPDLYNALDEAGIQSPRQLGKKLRALGLTRIGTDEHGAVWMCDRT